MTRLTVIAGFAVLPALLAGCPSTRTCQQAGRRSGRKVQRVLSLSEEHERPGHGGTQVESWCEAGSERVGSSLVGLGSLKHGIGLRWLDARTLEIAVPDGLALDYTHRISFHPEQGLTYRYPDLPYRSLRADDPDYAGCGRDS